MELAASSARESVSAGSGSLQPSAVDRNLPADGALPPCGRPRNPAQAPAENLLPDLRRRPRGAAGGRGPGHAPRLRLVLPLLSRSRAVPGAGLHARRDAAASRGRGHRSGQRRPPDAHPLGQPRAQHSQPSSATSTNCSTPWLRRGWPLLQPPSRGGAQCRGRLPRLPRREVSRR